MSGSHDGISYRCELIQSEETGAVEPVVGFERDAEERSVRLHGEVFQLSAVARHLAINCHVVGHFNIVTS